MIGLLFASFNTGTDYRSVKMDSSQKLCLSISWIKIIRYLYEQIKNYNIELLLEHLLT